MGYPFPIFRENQTQQKNIALWKKLTIRVMILDAQQKFDGRQVIPFRKNGNFTFDDITTSETTSTRKIYSAFTTFI